MIKTERAHFSVKYYNKCKIKSGCAFRFLNIQNSHYAVIG